MNISVLILTLNEEKNLPRCLKSVNWSDDVVVLDSHSKDGTELIAKEFGARFIQRAFDDYAGQRNFGLEEVQYRNPWLMMVDADEVVPPVLFEEMISSVQSAPDSICLFRLRRKDYFMGRWIKRSSGYPTWFGRLMRVGRVWVERDINEEYHTDGEVAALQGHLHHYPFNKGYTEWLSKHNRYSTMEAKHRFSSIADQLNWLDLFSRDPQDRRVATKKIFYSMPVRPLIAFLGLYLIKGGIVEGRAGLTFSLLRAIYEFMIDLKINELKFRKDDFPL
jgi:glycosyltransferase involved in cell wall biosynthesis